jgi:hypothetical protein
MAGTTEICVPLAFTRIGDCSEGRAEEIRLLANGLLTNVDKKAPVASKPKAITVTPRVRFMDMLLS